MFLDALLPDLEVYKTLAPDVSIVEYEFLSRSKRLPLPHNSQVPRSQPLPRTLCTAFLHADPEMESSDVDVKLASSTQLEKIDKLRELGVADYVALPQVRMGLNLKCHRPNKSC